VNVLDVDNIRSSISTKSREYVDVLEVFSEIESTNSFLMAQPRPAAGRFRVAIAEHQTAGRGRLDRTWQSPASTGLCMSMSYSFANTPENLPALSLVVGISVVQALGELDIHGIGLKWPNDVIACDGKVGGILTEVMPGKSDSVSVVIGLGLNVDLQAAAHELNVRGKLGKATDLKCCAEKLPGLSAMSAAIVDNLFDALIQFDADGFQPFYEAWPKFDWLRGQKIVVEVADGQIEGLVQGIEDDGALMVGDERVYSGSVSRIG
jgi:BirA family biotin operon repressor/biotin-[acetyl-CoA-carboxylase] ligase